MYKLCFKRKFIAQHFLIGGDWGTENRLHSHSYELELQLRGGKLDEHNYLVDLVQVEQTLKQVIGLYEDKTLNELPPFKDTNPSLELFSRIIAVEIAGRISKDPVNSIEVRLWENDSAWASWEQPLK